jgi:hypothetical protein
MRSLRFLLILVLAAIMDVGSPVLPEAAEGIEEVEEAAHGRRRAPILARAARPVSPSAVATATTGRRRPGLRQAPRRPSRAPIRKAPPPLAESASTADDH